MSERIVSCTGPARVSSSHRRTGTFLACIVGFLLHQAIASQEIMKVAQDMPGFKASMSYQDFGKGESVNLSNGGLVVTHASAISLPQNMGAVLGAARVYSSKRLDEAWEVNLNQNTDLPHGYAGMGWHLSFGRVFLRPVPHQKPDQSYVTHGEYFYQDESGAEHRLFRRPYESGGVLVVTENVNSDRTFPGSSEWYFTNDGSYIRAHYDAGGDSAHAGTWTIYFSDGSSRVAGGRRGLRTFLPLAYHSTRTDPSPDS